MPPVVNRPVITPHRLNKASFSAMVQDEHSYRTTQLTDYRNKYRSSTNHMAGTWIIQTIWSDHKSFNHWQHSFLSRAMPPVVNRPVIAPHRLNKASFRAMVQDEHSYRTTQLTDYRNKYRSSTNHMAGTWIIQTIWSDHKSFNHWQHSFLSRAMPPVVNRPVIVPHRLNKASFRAMVQDEHSYRTTQLTDYRNKYRSSTNHMAGTWIIQTIWSDHKSINHWRHSFLSRAMPPVVSKARFT